MTVETEARLRRHPAETRERMQSLWNEGHSTLEIGRRLGISKSAVCGLRRRMDLPMRPPAIKHNSSLTAGQSQEKPMPPRKNALPPEGTYPLDVPSTLPRSYNCQWPIGDPKKDDFRFCEGERVMTPEGVLSPYCPIHYAAAYPKRDQE